MCAAGEGAGAAVSRTAAAKRRGDREGTSPRLRADGRWQIDLRYTDSAGISRRSSVYGSTQSAARQSAKELRKRLELGQPARDTKSTLGAFASEWIGTALAASDRKLNTKTMYAGVARTHIINAKLGAMGLDKVLPRHVEGWLVELRAKGLSTSTVRSAYTILRAILDTAVRDGALATNPAAVIRRPKVVTTEAAFLSPEQVRCLLDASVTTRYARLFALLVNTGLRRGEALALSWADVDLTEGLLRVRGTLARVDGALVVTEPKTARSKRTVPLSPAAVDILRAVRASQLEERLRAGSQWHQTKFVFTTEFGEPCDPRNALRALKAAAGRGGLPPVGLHTLRHSAASVMLSNGVPLKVVSDMLGHSSIAITGDIYGHVSPDVSRDAVSRLSAALNGQVG
jgi:integrase